MGQVYQEVWLNDEEIRLLTMLRSLNYKANINIHDQNLESIVMCSKILKIPLDYNRYNGSEWFESEYNHDGLNITFYVKKDEAQD